MWNRKRRTENRRGAGVFSFLLILSFVILTGILVYSNWKIGRERKELAQRREELSKRVDQMEKEKERLEAGLSESETEAYWEERIREQGYKRPGEKVVVVKKQEKEESEINIESEEGKGSFWEMFLMQVRGVFK